jgi:hypothetical protein
MMLGLWLQVAGAIAPPPEPRRIVAVRSSAAVVVDGRLDDPVWRLAPVAGGWRQNDPDQGAPATAATDKPRARPAASCL